MDETSGGSAGQLAVLPGSCTEKDTATAEKASAEIAFILPLMRSLPGNSAQTFKNFRRLRR